MTPIAYVVETPFTQRDYERFGVKHLNDQGFRVQVWDCSSFLSNQSEASETAELFDADDWRRFSSLYEFANAVDQAGDQTIFLLLTGYGLQYRPLYHALTRAASIYGTEQFNALPTIARRRYLFTQLRKVPRYPNKIARGVFMYLPFRNWGIRPPNFLLAGGTSSITSAGLIGRETQIIWAHSLDYDIYLREKSTPVLKRPHEYAVFVDQYLPFHPDYAHFGLANPIAPERYYPKLVALFQSLEHALGIEVVIAAHPRSHYETQPDCFCGRDVIKGQSSTLIRNARIALAHHSTSVNFANLYHKPISFIDMSFDADNGESLSIAQLAAEFGKPPIHVDRLHAIDWKSELDVDESAYAGYRERYIKKAGSPEKPSWQIFADYVKSLIHDRDYSASH